MVTTFYTLVGILSILFSTVALDIITCQAATFSRGRRLTQNDIKQKFEAVKHTAKVQFSNFSAIFSQSAEMGVKWVGIYVKCDVFDNFGARLLTSNFIYDIITQV